LQQKLVKKEVARLFPKDHAMRIMEWYGRLNLCMEKMFVIRRRQSAATWTLEALCSNYPGPKLFQTEWNHSMASGKTLEVEETVGPSITESNYRAKASSAGKGYRMAEGSGMHLMTESAGRGGYDFRIQGMEERVQQSPGMVQDTRTPIDLPSHLIRSRKEKALTNQSEEELSQMMEKSEKSGFASGISEETEIEGFDGDALESILEELYMYVCEALSEIGKDTPVTEQIIMDCIPMFNLKTKNQSSTTKDFNRAVRVTFILPCLSNFVCKKKLFIKYIHY
jgi:hypothetical protein